MTDLKSLSEDELLAYQDAFLEPSKDNATELMCSNIIYQIDEAQKEIEVANKKLEDIKENIKHTREYTDRCDYLYERAADKLVSAISRLNALAIGTKKDNNLSVIKDGSGVDKIEILNNKILHVVLTGLLPKFKKKPGDSSGQWIERDKYQGAFFDFFQSHRLKYKERVVISFIHHFSKEFLVRDHDNMDSKLIIDLIAAYTLIDDSAVYCAHFHDYMLDTRDFTEIYVIPASNFRNYIS